MLSRTRIKRELVNFTLYKETYERFLKIKNEAQGYTWDRLFNEMLDEVEKQD